MAKPFEKFSFSTVGYEFESSIRMFRDYYSSVILTDTHIAEILDMAAASGPVAVPGGNLKVPLRPTNF